MSSDRLIWEIVGACALAATVAACGSSSPSSSSSTHATGPVAAITSNWEKFFNFQTPVSQRVALLQDGSQFPAAVLAATGLAANATAKVRSVTNVTSTQATVKYDVLLGNSPALPKQTGTAVYENGTWKVAAASFCGLLKLEISAKSMPTVCKTSS